MTDVSFNLVEFITLSYKIGIIIEKIIEEVAPFCLCICVDVKLKMISWLASCNFNLSTQMSCRSHSVRNSSFSTLREARRFMKLGSNSTIFYDTSHGVSQGPFFSPIFFNIYINPLA